MLVVNIISEDKIEVENLKSILRNRAIAVRSFRRLEELTPPHLGSTECVLMAMDETILGGDHFFEKLQKLNNRLPVIMIVDIALFRHLPKHYFGNGISFIHRPVKSVELFSLLDIFKRSYYFD